MNLGVFIPIVAILATAWVIVTAIRMGNSRHRSGSAESAKENERLAKENEELRKLASRLEERVAVLERIATDPSERTAREIDELR